MACDCCLGDAAEYVDVSCDNCGCSETHCEPCAVSKAEHHTASGSCGIFRPQ